MGQGEQRYLPGPAAVGVGKVVELVHGYAAHIGVLALAQRIVGKDFGRAADDGRFGVDMRIAGDHANVIAAEYLYQIEELFADQSLDRSRVVAALACAMPIKSMPSATSDLPDPVGVPKMT